MHVSINELEFLSPLGGPYTYRILWDTTALLYPYPLVRSTCMPLHSSVSSILVDLSISGLLDFSFIGSNTNSYSKILLGMLNSLQFFPLIGFPHLAQILSSDSVILCLLFSLINSLSSTDFIVNFEITISFKMDTHQHSLNLI